MSSQKWRNTREYRIWRANVIRRDKRCIVCGARNHRQAHHINSAKYHKDQRFLVENGVTLCRKCHTSLHCDMVGSFRMKCTEDDFNRFIKITNLKSIS